MRTRRRFIAEWIGAREAPRSAGATCRPVPADARSDRAVADDVFAPLRDWPRYAYNGAQVLQAHLRRRTEYQSAVVADRDLAVTDGNATEATPDQWQALQRARALVPNATVTLRTHRLSWKAYPKAPAMTVYGLLVAQSVGPLTVRREFESPAATPSDSAKSAGSVAAERMTLT